MNVGYGRVSTADQQLAPQIDALQQAGCEKVFTDVASGAKSERSGLHAVLHFVRPGDTLVVCRLDRLGRSLRHLIDTINDLDARGVGFRSVAEQLDTTTSGGRLIFHIFAAIAEFERDLIRERTQAGLKAARARGRLGGRPRALTPKKLAQAQAMLKDPNIAIGAVCETLGVSRSTLYREFHRRGLSMTPERIDPTRPLFSA